jgi:uncharacterized protein (TIGR02594 family)
MNVPGLPTQYQWLTKTPNLPNTIREGLKLFGTREVVGKGSNRTIISWRDELNGATKNGKPVIVGFHDDDIPWCGLYAAIVVFRRLKNISEVVASPLWARNWTKYGVEVSKQVSGKLVNVAGRVPSLGDVLVFVRNGGGHVGFYVGEDANYFHVLGGNQSNAVTITRIAKSRCIAVRRPPYVIPPKSLRPIKLAATGAVSKNEA